MSYFFVFSCVLIVIYHNSNLTLDSNVRFNEEHSFSSIHQFDLPEQIIQFKQAQGLQTKAFCRIKALNNRSILLTKAQNRRKKLKTSILSKNALNRGILLNKKRQNPNYSVKQKIESEVFCCTKINLLSVRSFKGVKQLITCLKT